MQWEARRESAKLAVLRFPVKSSVLDAEDRRPNAATFSVPALAQNMHSQPGDRIHSVAYSGVGSLALGFPTSSTESLVAGHLPTAEAAFCVRLEPSHSGG